MEMPDEYFMMLLLLDARHDATYDARDDDAPSHASCGRTTDGTGNSPRYFFHQCSALHFLKYTAVCEMLSESFALLDMK